LNVLENDAQLKIKLSFV